MKSKLDRLEKQVADFAKQKADDAVYVHVWLPRAEGRAVQAYAKRHRVSVNELVRRTLRMLIAAQVTP